MATIFSHSLLGFTLAKLAPRRLHSKKFTTLMTLLPIVPDLDYAGFVFGIKYNSFWGHRGFSHSLVFALIVAAIAAATFRALNLKNKILTGVFLFFSLTSHGLLDALTNGGLGVAFYSPFTTLRYFFPFTPIQVSPMGFSFFSQRGLAVMVSEFFWIISPCLMALAILSIISHRNKYDGSI